MPAIAFRTVGGPGPFCDGTPALRPGAGGNFRQPVDRQVVRRFDRLTVGLVGVFEGKIGTPHPDRQRQSVKQTMHLLRIARQAVDAGGVDGALADQQHGGTLAVRDYTIAAQHK